LAARVPPDDDREPRDEPELLAVLEPLEDRDALAVLLLDASALWARARVDCDLRFGWLAGLDDERLEVLPRLDEPLSLTADISTPPIRFHQLGAFQNAEERVLSQAYPLRSSAERPRRMSQQALRAPGRMF
jgi:hypothetical protein